MKNFASKGFCFYLQILTEKMLFEVSERLVNREEVTRLGVHLGVPYRTIEKTFTDYANSLIIAANHILNVWFDKQNEEHPYQTMVQALVDCGHLKIAKQALNYSS